MKADKKTKDRKECRDGNLKVRINPDEDERGEWAMENLAVSLSRGGGREALQDMAAYMMTLASELYDYDPAKEDACPLLGVIRLQPDMRFRFDLYTVEEEDAEKAGPEDGCRNTENEETEDSAEGAPAPEGQDGKEDGADPECPENRPDREEGGNRDEDENETGKGDGEDGGTDGSFLFTDVEKLLPFLSATRNMMQDMLRDMDYLKGLLYSSRQVVFLSDSGGMKRKMRNRMLDYYCDNAAAIADKKWGPMKDRL